jgi:hypothetical protein
MLNMVDDGAEERGAEVSKEGRTMKPAIDGMSRRGMSASDIVWEQVELLKAGKDLPLLPPTVQLNVDLPASMVHAVVSADAEDKSNWAVATIVAPSALPERHRKRVRAARARTRERRPLRDLPRWKSAEFWELATPAVKAAADKWAFVATIGYVNRGKPFEKLGAMKRTLSCSPGKSSGLR